MNEVGIQNSEISEEKMIAAFLEEGIICMESALFYYGYSDKIPLVWTIAVPRNISRSKILPTGILEKIDEILSLMEFSSQKVCSGSAETI